MGLLKEDEVYYYVIAMLNAMEMFKLGLVNDEELIKYEETIGKKHVAELGSTVKFTDAVLNYILLS